VGWTHSEHQDKEHQVEHIFSRVMQFPAKHRVARVIRTRAKSESIASIAKHIYDCHLRGIQQLRAAAWFYLDLCYTIDKVKIETIGMNAPTDVSNAIQVALGHEVLKGTTWDEEADDRWLDEFYRNFTSTTKHMSQWGATKLLVLQNGMRHLAHTRSFALAQLGIPDQMIVQAESEYDSVEGHIREMMERLTELRRYGVKSSFTKRGFLPNMRNAWVMWDHRDLMGVMNIFGGKSQIATIALSTDADQIKDLRPESVSRENTESTGFALPFPASFIWSMSNEAEFSILSGYDSLRVRDIFESTGKKIHYQAIRLQLLYHLYDLIVPVAKLATLPSAETPKKGTLKKLTELLTGAKKDPVVDLILPRMRLLDDRLGIVEAVEKEVEESAIKTRERSMRRHEVIDFIRPLPPGHNPSATARKLAWEAFGIELRDNETYVRAHWRGAGEVITAHRARRQGS